MIGKKNQALNMFILSFTYYLHIMYNCTYIIPIERLDMWILGFQKILIESLKYFEISHLQLGTRIYRANVCTYYLLG